MSANLFQTSWLVAKPREVQVFKTIAICAAIALAFLSPAVAQEVSQAADAPAAAAAANEVPQSVKDACKDDYEKHCSAHAPENAAARDCMAHAFEKLSDPCVTAILDSPLAEQEQQRVANTRSSEETEATTHDIRSAKPATRTAKAKRAAPEKYAGTKNKRHVAQRASAKPRSVAGHIRRGTGIANHYVAKYTRFAFARAFR